MSGAPRWRQPTLALLVLIGACASAQQAGVFRRSVGNASGPDAIERTRRVLALHQFEIEREEHTPQLILVQSRWLQRDPFVDEALLGIAAAENRVTVSGRFRLETEQGPVYAIDLLVERRVTMLGHDGWVEAPSGKAYTAYAEAIRNDLVRELNVGTRRF